MYASVGLNVLMMYTYVTSLKIQTGWYKTTSYESWSVNYPQCIRRISHNASFNNRNMQMCACLCYKMVHCEIFVWSIVDFVRWVYSTDVLVVWWQILDFLYIVVIAVLKQETPHCHIVIGNMEVCTKFLTLRRHHFFRGVQFTIS